VETACYLAEDKHAHCLMIIKGSQPGLLEAAAALAGPRRLASYARNHWSIENREHYVRDKTFGEDLQQVRTGNQPNAYAAIRNLVTGTFRRTGFSTPASLGGRPALHRPFIRGEVAAAMREAR
jgi:hypothetical protein